MTEAPHLEMIPPHGLRAVWPLIRDRLAKLAETDRWIPEEVFAEIAGSNTFLWTTPQAEGFVVLQVHSSTYERVLHVWIAINNADADAAAFIPQLLEIAADHGCARLTWESGRKGWERAVPQASVHYIYSVPVGGPDGQQED